MKEVGFDWKIWLDSKEKLEESFDFYLKKDQIRIEKEKDFLSKSHLKKAEENLKFCIFLKNNEKFYDWIIVGSYYSIYHAALALITKKGYSSKNHLATLCALIKYYYFKRELTKEEIELVSNSYLNKEEISYFAYAKTKREEASYGISDSFNKKEALDLLEKALSFLNKSREILENERYSQN